MKPKWYEYQSELAKSYVAEGRYQGLMQGRLEGRQEGRAALLQRQLALRFGPLPQLIAVSVGAASIDELDALGDRLLTADSLTAALGSLEPRDGERLEHERELAQRYREQGRTQGRFEGKLEGRLEGRVEGRIEGQLELAARLLQLRFGPIPAAVSARLAALATEEVAAMTERLLSARSLEEALGQP